ncbi:MAG: Crp/Fnr family transcriptional regulator [Chitinophagaceae bacterium]|nr:Crp/Fnr family transcriptional regulator [Chitinophagaceae bacterium]
MIEFVKTCNRLSPLDEVASSELENKLKTRSLKKDQHLLTRTSICNHLFFIDSGLTKTYFNNGEKEFIMRFFREGEMFTVLDSFITQQPSTYAIKALEATEVSYIEQKDLEELCRKHHCIETFFRKLVSIAAVNMMKRISEMLEENASTRYAHFLKDNGHLLQRISLGDLASYLGITQVSLSRIRSQR